MPADGVADVGNRVRDGDQAGGHSEHGGEVGSFRAASVPCTQPRASFLTAFTGEITRRRRSYAALTRCDPQFRILGPIEVDLEDGAAPQCPAAMRSPSSLCCSCTRGDAVHLDRAVDELWTGSGPETRKNAVHVVASRLRAALGDGLVVSEAGALRAAPATGSAGRRPVRGALPARPRDARRGEPGRRPKAWLQALALWRGEALAEVRYERFAQPEISRLEDLRLDCLSERIDADLALGREVEAAAELEALVAIHPLHERLRGQQMLALYRGGRQADALAAYRAAHEALVDGLGIEPSPELRALQVAILRQDVPPRLPQAPLGADRGRSPATPGAASPASSRSRTTRWPTSTRSPFAPCSSATTTSLVPSASAMAGP